MLARQGWAFPASTVPWVLNVTLQQQHVRGIVLVPTLPQGQSVAGRGGASAFEGPRMSVPLCFGGLCVRPPPPPEKLTGLLLGPVRSWQKGTALAIASVSLGHILPSRQS